MAANMSHVKNPRLLVLNDTPFSGTSVIYIMSRDQRVKDNHALLSAQSFALENNVPLYVLFVLKKTSSRSCEHYEFMLKGLKDVEQSLSSHSIPFIIRCGDTVSCVTSFAEEVDAGAVFFDFSPLTAARKNSKRIAKMFNGFVAVVDTHNCVPVWIASDKREFAAHTMRSKVHKLLETYLVEPEKLAKQSAPKNIPPSASSAEIDQVLESIPNAGITINFEPGESAALAHLDEFLQHGLATYAAGRNNIADDLQSNLSPYLHFGHISSLRVALDTMQQVGEPPLLFSQARLAQSSDQHSKSEGMNALFEEMIVRKELSDNFCFYSDSYVLLTAAQDWAQATLETHASDPRDVTYSREQWESANTHDDAWNASQIELTKTGKIHSYMRMYWAKKMLEWSETPEKALQTAIYLNDKYSIDGGDPNGYVGILWSIAGIHDRPWTERPVFGKIRYMNRAGLKRKFDIDEYIRRVTS